MKKIICITWLIIICFCVFTPYKIKAANATTGHTVEETGQQIAKWAKEFCEGEAAGKYTCSYELADNDTTGSPRSISYNSEIKDGGQYGFECVGWVSFAIHHATGIGAPTFTIFAAPYKYGKNEHNFKKGYLEEIWGSDTGVSTLPSGVTVLPGDILIMYGHVGIYLGKNESGQDIVADIWRNENRRSRHKNNNSIYWVSRK